MDDPFENADDDLFDPAFEADAGGADGVADDGEANVGYAGLEDGGDSAPLLMGDGDPGFEADSGATDDPFGAVDEGAGEVPEGGDSTVVGDTTPENVEEDCSALVEWRTQWRQQLDEKARIASGRKQAKKDAALQTLANMKEQRQKRMAAKAETNRQQELQQLEQLQSQSEPGSNPWERVVSLVDVQVDDKDADVSRMRSILLKLKSSESGPGISC